MKIIISGQKGYLANELKKYNSTEKKHEIELISVRKRSENWSSTHADVFIHTAALVHKNESELLISDYYSINKDLTVELAMMAKKNGFKQFVFFSTMAVFGVNDNCIDENTKLEPISYYGKSKLSAEKELRNLESPNFSITIIRPPMIYGPNCPGNYNTLSKLAKFICIFPEIDNKRSMIYIKNLCEFTFQTIENNDRGTFHPQDSNYIKTSEMVKEIALANERPLYLSKFAGKLVKFLIGRTSLFKKVFGDLYYSKNYSQYRKDDYQKFPLKQAINSIEIIERK